MPEAHAKPDPERSRVARMHAQLAEAQERAQERSHGVLLGFTLGLASIAVLGFGIVLVALLFRRDRGSTPAISGSFGGPLGSPFVNVWPVAMPPMTAQAQLPVAAQLPAPIAVSVPTAKETGAGWQGIVGQGPTVRSYGVTPTQNALLAQATNVPARATVRAVHPPGSFIIVAYDEASLRGAGVTVGNTFIIPAGQEREFRLLPRQSIYGKSDVAGAVVSVARTDAPADGIGVSA